MKKKTFGTAAIQIFATGSCTQTIVTLSQTIKQKKRSEVCWFWKRFRSSVGSINALEALQSLETNSTSSFQSVKISGVTEESADFGTRI